MSRSVSKVFGFGTLVLVFGVGCGATVAATPDSGVSDDRPGADRVDGADSADVPRVGRVPQRHRVSGATCPAQRAASTCDPGMIMGPPVTCRADSDCSMGTNGRCQGHSRAGCNCNYDTCSTDGDCRGGGPCVCRESAASTTANRCYAGNCQVDANCGAGGYCSPSFGSCGTFGGVVGYYCHTPQDECVDDSDCAAQLDGGFLGQTPYCMYAPERGRWMCSNQGCAG